MKRILSCLLACLLLTGCASDTVAEVTTVPAAPAADLPTAFSGTVALSDTEAAYISRFSGETVIFLSDEGITVDGGAETEAVFTSRDIVYYEDRDTYGSGNPYGEGTDADRHSAEEAAAHTVVNITAPGAYRISGKLSAGQIRVDLGEEARTDAGAAVELILDNADITCTVAPAILFLNTYECDADWSAETATANVDTSAAGASLILEGDSTVSGSHVAKIYKDAEGEKKLWKQDGAIYSYTSLNVFGPGSLTLTADNEGLDTELHLTVNGGDIRIFSDNDGINTNEDGVSVTTVNGGRLHITAGLGDEGDGIDSNGYLVINGGTVITSANPAADAGLDADLGSYIHGGTVIALGSTMDWAESSSGQVTVNLRFAAAQSGDSPLVIASPDGTVVFAYDPGADTLRGTSRQYMGAIISCPGMTQGERYYIYSGGSLSGDAVNGLYRSVTGYRDDCILQHSGGFGTGMGRPGGQMPEDMELPEDMEMPEGTEMARTPEADRGHGADGKGQGSFGGGREPGSQRPESEEMTPPEGFDGEMPTLPEGETVPEGEMPQSGFGPGGNSADAGAGSIEFYMRDKVNAFSSVMLAADATAEALPE